MKRRLFFWAITSALAGFLFGFDTIVISGAEQQIQQLWSLSSFMHGLTTSAALWGTVLGALLGGIPAEKYGRKKVLLCTGILYFVSAIGSALAKDPTLFMMSRFIGGLGVGIATIASPLYISEISPANKRGRLAGLFQFNIVFGILVAYVSNFLIGKYMNMEVAWRWMLGVEAIPAFIFSALCLTLPESPRWLITHAKNIVAGRTVFQRINVDMSDKEIDGLVNDVENSAKKDKTTRFFSKEMRVPISLAFFIAFFNQLSGINAILYFAPRIFEWTGLGQQAALLQSIGIGVTTFVFTYIGIGLIDRLGRRTLLYIGSVGYILSLGLCAIFFKMENYAIIPYCIFAFIAAHAVGQGTVIWVFISEIFPNQFRAMGQTLGSFTHWLFAALLTLVFPKMSETLSPTFIFGFFCIMMVFQLIWVNTKVPETKGVKLEEMEKKLR